MSGWPFVELGDCVDMAVGFPFKSRHFLDRSTDAIRLLRGDNVAQGSLRWDGVKHWAADDTAQYEGYALRERDVILAMDRPWIEAGLKYAYVRQSDLPCLLVQRVARLRGTTTLSTDYLRYIIGSPAFTAHVLGITTGVNVPHISGRDIKRFRFALPPFDTQRRIASILGAYDDLIEVNRRRMALLEDIARDLFEEWFIRFRFPGHDAVTLIDTPRGALPKGWDWGTVADYAETTGSTINPSLEPDKIFAHFSLPAFDSGRWPVFERGDTIRSNKLAFQTPVVLVSKLNPRIPRIWYVSRDVGKHQASSTEFVPLSPLGAHRAALIKAIVSNPQFRDRLTVMAGGTSTSHQRVKPKDVLNTPVPVPRDDVSLAAGRHLEALYDLAEGLGRANRHLAASRDLLLPRLISGQLSVTAAERELDAA